MMKTYRSRRQFVKRLLALPLLAAAPPLGRLLAQGAPLRARVLSARREGAPWDAVRVAVSMPAPG